MIQFGTYSGGSCTALGKNLLNRPCTDTTTGGGSTLSKSTYQYDANGNLLSLGSLVSGSTFLTKAFSYYPTGLINVATDANGGTTTYTYGACNGSFPTTISEPMGLTRTIAWDCTGETPTSITDENNQPTTYSYVSSGGTADPFWRVLQENFPDGGQTSWTYNSPTSITTTTKMNSSQNIVSKLLLDGLGRASQTQLTDPQGTDYTDTTYDVVGRVASVSNPYRSTSDPTYGLTSYRYDALSRPTLIIPPDGSPTSNNISVTYVADTNALMTTVTDQAGNQRRSWTDALGRTIQVNEPAGSPPSLGTPSRTFHSFDALSNLTQVSQHGTNESDSSQWRVRTFAYDALSRLTSETNPESGTASYYYTTSGGALCSGAPTQLCRRTAPAPNQTGSATVTTTYSWDALHRLTGKIYTDWTPSLYYSYDVSPPWITGVTNPVGRLVDAYNQFQGTSGSSAAATVNSYDAVGRIVRQWQQTPSLSPGGDFLYYTYDLAGNMTSYSNGVGITFTQSFNTAGRSTGLTSSLVDSTHPATLATVDSSVGYYPHGGIHKATLGNGLTSTNVFYNTLQPCLIDVNNNGTVLQTCNDSSPSGNVLDLAYNYNQGSANNGNVVGWNATGNQSFVRTFGYDSLNRLSTLNQSSGNGTGCSATFNLSWTYDAWGNRTDQNLNSGTCGQFHATVNTKNQIYDPVNSIYQYDAAGNMTYDGNHHYFYDAENRLAQVDGTLGTCSTATACYAYDAVGRRVEKATGSTYVDYLYDLAGNVLTEWCTNCGGYTGPTTEYIFMSGNFVAEYKNNTTYFIHGDHLGSARLLTDLNQAVVQNLDYLPFGELNSSDSGITTHKFTGGERDSETSLDHTWFRQYSSSLGRWMHPDPAGLAAVDITNPQSWNRYAYVINSPLTYIDPLGLTMQMICMPGYSVGYDDYQGSGQWGPISGWCTYYDDGFNYPGNVSLSYNNSPTTSGGGGGGGGNNSGNWFKRAVNATCSLVADAGTVGVGGDMGLGITGSGQLNLTANGASGELTLSLSQGLSGGVIGPDAYVSVSVTPTAPDNSFLDTHGQASTSNTVGYSRYGASCGGGTYGATLGPSLSPVTAAKSGMLSKPLITLPYAGYVAHPARAVCKAITGN